METWEKPSSRRHHRNPSFSSSLLDQIYRSIDDSPPLESTRKKKLPHEDLETSQDKLVFHRRSIAADFERSRRTTTTTAAAADSVFLRYSNSTSSDSSGLSSSESDSFYGRSKSSFSPPQPKPICTSGERPNSKQELGGFLRTKSKALKIYTDLKKVKQPISPGGRLATFLNSLFTNASTKYNPKKPKKNSSTSISVLSETQSSSSTTCSSASSFSRSCLSKTPSSSSGKSKRSVRFCPVNVILDEDSSVYIPCGNNNNNYNNDAKRYRHVMEEENRRVIEAAKDLIRTYQKNKDLLTVTTCDNVEDDDDDDDAASYASSDLFELENLSAIGIERYQEELPVYETTRLDNTNRAIATSLIV
ncbi:Uncharacterized protein Rs2_26505 [Raphanus sativus]|uniref:Protein BIG GRAIN 1-like A n=1 Tax=Raphanus sativus TaxID=3726 RepID=A0A6J0JGV1_RAPSA|nr:protein BIG GRAIN 1-like A [Raphanus sativus]KAJ4886757.1 Uncharacterized protein Rs2_26505 [Raphanus sativus]